MGAFQPDSPWPLPEAEVPSYPEIMLDTLRRAVGGEDALDKLDAVPLPDEPFAWAPIPADIHARVTEVLRLVDRCCDELLDVEYRTACRRYLGRAAAADPEIFRRRSRAETAAAAICWGIGKANDLFNGVMLVKDLMAHFGIEPGWRLAAQRAPAARHRRGSPPVRGHEPRLTRLPHLRPPEADPRPTRPIPNHDPAMWRPMICGCAGRRRWAGGSSARAADAVVHVWCRRRPTAAPRSATYRPAGQGLRAVLLCRSSKHQVTGSSGITTSSTPICSPPSVSPTQLAAGHGPHDQEGLGSPRDRVGQRGVRRLVGQVLLAGEEPHERPALAA